MFSSLLLQRLVFVLVAAWLALRALRLRPRAPVWASPRAEVFSIEKKQWTPTQPLVEPFRWPTLSRAEDGTILAAFDHDPAGKEPAQQRYNPQSNEWSLAPSARFVTEVPEQPPEKFHGEVLTWSTGALAWELKENTTNAYRAEEQQWIATAAPPHEFDPCGACALPNGELFLVGIIKDSPCTLHWQRGCNQWSTSFAPPPIAPSLGSVLVAINDNQVLALLSDGKNPQCALFSLSENQWTTVPRPALVDDQCALIAIDNKQVLAVGGTTAEQIVPALVLRKILLAVACVLLIVMGIRVR